VEVQMKDRLASSLANIDAHCVAVRLVLSLDNALCFSDSINQLVLLFRRRVEPGCNMPLRNQQRVTGCHWESIP
jgi:hypothetical protein